MKDAHTKHMSVEIEFIEFAARVFKMPFNFIILYSIFIKLISYKCYNFFFRTGNGACYDIEVDNDSREFSNHASDGLPDRLTYSQYNIL